MVPTPFGPVKLRPPDRLERRHAQVSFVTDPRVGQQDLQGRAVLVVGPQRMDQRQRKLKRSLG